MFGHLKGSFWTFWWSLPLAKGLLDSGLPVCRAIGRPALCRLKPLPSQPTWGNNTHHHLARQPHQCGQNICYQKLRPVCEKRELQFFNNPDPTHSFLSTPTAKSRVLRCRHMPRFHRHAKQTTTALMSQSMIKESAQHAKLPQVLLGAMFA